MRTPLAFILGLFSYPLALNLLSKLGDPWIGIPEGLEKAENYSQFIQAYLSGATNTALLWFAMSWLIAALAVGWVTGRIAQGMVAVLILALFKGVTTASVLIDTDLPLWLWATLIVSFGPVFILGGLLGLPKKVDVTVSKFIPKDPGYVSEFAMNPDNEILWISGINKTKNLSGGSVQVGSQIQREVRFMGKDIIYVLQVSDFEPKRYLRMKSVSGPFPMDVSYTFEKTGVGCTVENRVSGGPENIFSPLMASFVRFNLSRDLASLSRMVAP